MGQTNAIQGLLQLNWRVLFVDSLGAVRRPATPTSIVIQGSDLRLQFILSASSFSLSSMLAVRHLSCKTEYHICDK